MQLNKLLIIPSLLLTALTFQSCLKNQEDVFEKSSSERLQEAMAKAKTVLTSSENGWIFDYYPDRKLSYGGTVYTVTFNDAKVVVRNEKSPREAEESLYKITDDCGPVLSFDSYNTLMHYYATPSSKNYQAYDGDFEFLIIDVTDDLITLRGKRTYNTMYLRRLKEDAGLYMQAVGDKYNTNVVRSFEGKLGGADIACGNNLTIHYMQFSWGEDQKAGEYYLTTPTGIRFRNPVNVNGTEIAELKYDFDRATNTGTLTFDDNGATKMTLTGSLPATYAFFEDYLGDFTINYNSKIDVKIEGDSKEGTYKIKGLSSKFDMVATYNTNLGCLEINSQLLANDNGNDLWLYCWAVKAGAGLSKDKKFGVYVKKDPDNPGTYVITPNDGGFETDSFYIWFITPENQGLTVTDNEWKINGTDRMLYLKSFVKKQ